MKFQENSMNFRSKVRKVQICYELLLFWSLPEGAKTEKSMIFYKIFMEFHKKSSKWANVPIPYIYTKWEPPREPLDAKSVKNETKCGQKWSQGAKGL